MAGDYGYTTPTSNIVARGTPPVIVEKTVETATNVYPGRLLAAGTTDHDVIVNSGILPVVGIAGYEHTREEYRKEANTTIYTAADDIAVLRGSGFAAYLTIASGFYALEGDQAIPWGAGYVAPGYPVEKGFAVRIAFSKNASEADTTVDIPGGMYVTDCIIDVNTAVASGTIDVGMLSTEASGDADGFVDGVSCAAAGDAIPLNRVDATAANNTLGALLVEADIKSADGTPLYLSPYTRYVCDGTTVSVSYTTSNHAIAGYIMLVVQSPGTRPIGTFVKATDASAAATAAIVEVHSL